ncbi:hypothetical protein [Terrisporobacter mayombei]|uniref:Uncharacterized protein n=1 Tax=Terrisporobacter mayombei TaxID=1541 RepID=A0ABY9Q4D7_9FIRM|nr:hypothetical protein [Terrisporobacter mayombei]MCC3868989.1 hypothetical protein [Terrisporobacter mayombei]WMT82878.1 hypothetical protein TEMA_33740 [Terrisporobacter mayombei]
MINKYLENNVMDGMGRCSDMIWISFGKELLVRNYRNEEVKKSEYALHIQCPFRISRNNKILLSNYDIYTLIEGSINDDWDVIGNNRYDKIVNGILLPMLPLKVNKVNYSEIGDIEILLEDNIVINIFVNSSDLVEEWRFINNHTGNHYVFREE